MNTKLVPIATLALLMTGCAFLQSHTREVRGLAYAAASVGTTVTLQAKPQYRLAFELALASLSPLVDSGSITGAQLRAILAELPVAELSSPTARIVIDNATMLFDVLTGSPVDLRDAPVLLAAATGIRDGLRAGLSLK